MNEAGQPITHMLAAQFGLPFILAYVASYMLVTMGIFNVILAVPWLIVCDPRTYFI
jgi:hypothetical protein